MCCGNADSPSDSSPPPFLQKPISRSKSCFPDKNDIGNDSAVIPNDDHDNSPKKYQAVCISKLDIRQDRHGFYVDKVSKKAERVSLIKSEEKYRGRPISSSHDNYKVNAKILPEDDSDEFANLSNFDNSANNSKNLIDDMENNLSFSGDIIKSPKESEIDYDLCQIENPNLNNESITKIGEEKENCINPIILSERQSQQIDVIKVKMEKTASPKAIKVFKQDLSKISWKKGFKSPQIRIPPTNMASNLPSPIHHEDTSFSLNTTASRKANQTILVQDQNSLNIPISTNRLANDPHNSTEIMPIKDANGNNLNIKMHFIVDQAPPPKEDPNNKSQYNQTMITSPSYIQLPPVNASVISAYPPGTAPPPYPYPLPGFYGMPMNYCMPPYQYQYPYPYPYQCPPPMMGPPLPPASYYYPSSVCSPANVSSFWRPPPHSPHEKPINLTQNVAISLPEPKKTGIAPQNTSSPVQPKVSPLKTDIDQTPDSIKTPDTAKIQQENTPAIKESQIEEQKTIPFDIVPKTTKAAPVLLTFDIADDCTTQRRDTENKLSLADLFKLKKKSLATKYSRDSKKSTVHEIKTRTKEEILSQRREMMQSKIKPLESPKKGSHTEENLLNFNKNSLTVMSSATINNATSNNQNKKKEPSLELLERLARGEKPKIKKDQMRKLTSKNYELLPEVKAKKEMEKKKQEWKERMEKTKKLEKVFF